ncbi:bromodomain-containing protein homolog isoform X2 [Bacillus rossius redtenbacheri]|uniref:bromodomain-containing protein homolog isoform X2 n=1 Tax=Bacillus rossius redtenbacheri TaxID=93214 RepID=UPI002FDEA68C
MRLDIDVGEYCRKLRAEKQPPYECPFIQCGKVYKSLCGLQYHLLNVDHNATATAGMPVVDGVPVITPTTPSGRKKSRGAHHSRSSTVDILTPPAREGLTYAEAQKMVEFEFGNITTRVSIYEELQVYGLEEALAAGLNLEDLRINDAKFKQQSEDSKLNLPDPSFRILDDYKISDAPPMPNSYIRFIERSAEELDTEVEYDMDEEDCAWLSIINETRVAKNLPEVPVDTFELLMDRLEKESYFQMQSSSKCGEDTAVSMIDDDAVCCICMDGECQNSNVILFCDMCNLAVHQDCYGVPYIPEGQWLCRRCLQSPSRAVDCVLCPNNGGAFKQTDRGHWAHVVCALWIPEVRFANTVFLEPIDSIEMIPPARWKLTCYICKQRGVGACIQCHKTNCYAAFHVTCAQHAGLFMKMETVRDSHGGVSASITLETGPILVQKTAFCDAHTPADAETRPRLPLMSKQKDHNHQHQAQVLNHHQQQSGTSRTESNSGNETHKDDSQEKMHNARKILAKKRSAVPIISIPTIPPDRIQDIASRVNLVKKNQFIQRLIAYWTLKRQMRNGVPLLRRLQSSHLSRRGDFHPQQEVGELYRQLKYWQCLRQDLERARLLCELVRKREKLKNELCKVKEKSLELELQPCVCFLRQLWEIVQAKDTGDIFREPVDQTEVLDYADVVKQPMDLSTMKTKLESHQYPDLWSFEADFKLMIQNCMAYNSRDTIFYKAAVKLRDQCAPLFRMAERDFVTGSFDLANDVLQSVGEDAKNKSSNDISTTNTKSDSQNKQPDSADVCQPHVSNETLAVTKNDRNQPRTEHVNCVEGLTNVQNTSVDSPRVKHTRGFKVEFGKNQSKNSSSAATKGGDSSSEDGFESDTEHEETTDEDSGKKSVTTNSTTANGKVKSTTNSAPPRRFTRRFAKDAAKLSAEKETGTASAVFTPAQTPTQSLSMKTVSPTGINRRTAVLFTRKAAAAAFRKPEPAILSSNVNTSSGPSSTPVVHRRRVGRPRKNVPTENVCTPRAPSPIIPLAVVGRSESTLDSVCPVPCSESFRVYRSGGDIPGETDDDTQSDSSCSSCSSTDDSSGSSGDSSSLDLARQTGAESSAEDDSAVASQGSVHKLEPLDLAWAKCRGYPWYPALIINPKMPRTGYLHNGVPIPAPPLEVLALAANYSDPVYLVLFFDTKRTWQWLPRNKLEPLGVLLEVDQAKLVESRKPTDRKAVRKAYQEALHHRCQVTGANTASGSGATTRKNKLPVVTSLTPDTAGEHA